MDRYLGLAGEQRITSHYITLHRITSHYITWAGTSFSPGSSHRVAPCVRSGPSTRGQEIALRYNGTCDCKRLRDGTMEQAIAIPFHSIPSRSVPFHSLPSLPFHRLDRGSSRAHGQAIGFHSVPSRCTPFPLFPLDLREVRAEHRGKRYPFRSIALHPISISISHSFHSTCARFEPSTGSVSAAPRKSRMMSPSANLRTERTTRTTRNQDRKVRARSIRRQSWETDDAYHQKERNTTRTIRKNGTYDAYHPKRTERTTRSIRKEGNVRAFHPERHGQKQETHSGVTARRVRVGAPSAHRDGESRTRRVRASRGALRTTKRLHPRGVVRRHRPPPELERPVLYITHLESTKRLHYIRPVLYIKHLESTKRLHFITLQYSTSHCIASHAITHDMA